MACKTCNLVKCGCQDSYLTTPPPCPVPSDCPTVQPCSEVFDSQCVIYSGDDITCNAVVLASTGTPVNEALVNIANYFCSDTVLLADVMCGVDIVVPINTSAIDAVPLIVTYFCAAITALEDNISFNTYGLFTATADAIVAGTSSPTSIVGTGVGSMLIAGNSLVQGDTFRLKAHGDRHSDTVTTLTIEVFANAVLIGTTGAFDVNLLTPNKNWEFEAEIVVRTIGVGGTLQLGGSFTSPVLLADSETVQTMLQTTVVNTTIGQTIDIVATYSNPDPSNTITSRIVTLIKIY